MGKGEIARYEQFLLFPQCFQKACFLGVSKGVIVWEWVNPLTHNFEREAFENIERKGENIKSPENALIQLKNIQFFFILLVW